LADWELRIGRYRVFYDVDVANRVVRILAVGVKERNRLLIGGQEVLL
jgi:mRNA-degrading endonuclease RelE of RelBE toxin-antitoxin system